MGLFQVLSNAFRLDTVAANHLFTSTELGWLSDGHPLRPNRRGILRGIRRVAGMGFRGFSALDLYNWMRQTKPRPVFFAETQHQFEALKGPMSASQNEPLLAVLGDVRPGHTPAEMIRFPYGAAALLSLLFVPVALCAWFRTRGYAKRSFRYVFEKHCMAYGMYLMWAGLARSGLVQCLVVANDCTFSSRVAVKAARDARVATIYLQHASVTSSFPPLSMDFALLEGKDALEKYGHAGASSSCVYLVGMPKADRFKLRSPYKSVETIGLCFNKLETLADVEAICSTVRSAFPSIATRIRPHPRTHRAEIEAIRHIADANGCGLSDPAEEDVAAFLSTADLLVAGESSIHLEATLCNIRSVYYAGWQQPRDIYRYHTHGLVDPPVRSPKGLVEALHNASVAASAVRNRAKYYVDTVGTARDGRSSELVAQIIDQICTTGTISHVGWTRVQNDRFHEVWRLAADEVSRHTDLPMESR